MWPSHIRNGSREGQMMLRTRGGSHLNLEWTKGWYGQADWLSSLNMLGHLHGFRFQSKCRAARCCFCQWHRTYVSLYFHAPPVKAHVIMRWQCSPDVVCSSSWQLCFRSGRWSSLKLYDLYVHPHIHMFHDCFQDHLDRFAVVVNSPPRNNKVLWWTIEIDQRCLIILCFDWLTFDIVVEKKDG